jgi:hypothetical protein
MVSREIRYCLRGGRGVYLGNNWWTDDLEAKQVNCIRTYLAGDDEVFRLQEALAGVGGIILIPVGSDVVDMSAYKISERSAVRHEIVTRPWTTRGGQNDTE